MENQIIEGDKTETNACTSKKEAHKKLIEDTGSEEEQGEKQKSSTEICGKEIETYEKGDAEKQQKSEQNKEESGQISKDMK